MGVHLYLPLLLENLYLIRRDKMNNDIVLEVQSIRQKPTVKIKIRKEAK